MSAAVMSAWSCVALINVVVRSLPFQCTTDDATKFVPVTVNVNAALPATLSVGDRELTVGPGFGVFMVKVCALDVPPPGVGLTTVTKAVPAVAMSAAVIWAVSWVLLPNVVERAAPFHWTVDGATKLVPDTVRRKP